jgi:exopolyphosphatase/guanosine-5'-triphosphate,3'-diphosphate pyrophosphatase
MRITTIDIGTNTILMLIGDYDKPSQQINVLFDIQRIPRLGKGVDSNKIISGESIQKAVKILNEYKEISIKHNSNKIIAAATSFLRDAHNKNEFVNKMKTETGIEIEILSGKDEARWTFWGGIYEQLQIADYKLQICSLDIGGGSTEITLGENIPPVLNKNILLNHPIKSISLDVGSVRVNEKFLNTHPPSFENVVKAEEFINENLNKINFPVADSKLIGVAGTITTLAAIKLKLIDYDAVKVDGIVLSYTEVQGILDRLTPLPIEELYSLGNFMEGRADVIIPGVLILRCFMQKFGFNKITVSTKGLRYGIFLREMI